MSKRNLFGLSFAEKIFGIIIAAIGIILTYYTYTNPDAAGISTQYFLAAGIILIVLGVILVIVKSS